MRLAPSIPTDIADALRSVWGPLARYAHPTRIDLGSRRIGTATDAQADEDLVTLRQVKRLVADVRTAATTDAPTGALSQEIVRGHLVPDVTKARNIGTSVKQWLGAWFSGVVRALAFGLEDSDASHHLLLKTTSNLTADRDLTFVPGDNSRTITLSGNPTLNDWFDQSVKAAASPTFAGMTLASVTNSTGLAHGTYTPTLTNVANLDGSTAYECQYLRVGNTVIVSGLVDVNPTAAGTSTQLGISLPIASNLGAPEDCAGVAFASAVAADGAAVQGDAANNRAEMIWVTGSLANHSKFFIFQYQVI